MSYSSRNQSSRRVYADINGSGYRSHDNSPKDHRPRPPRERHVDYSFHMHAPHDSHMESHRHASYDNCGPPIYVTSYSTPTNGEFITSHHQPTNSYSEATTSYHQSTTTYHASCHSHRGSTAHESHLSPSGYTYLHHQGMPHAPSLDDEDERYSSDRGKHRNSRTNDHREEDASGNDRNDHHYRDREHREGPQPREPKSTHTDGYPSKSKNDKNRKYTANNSPGQGKPDNGSQRHKKPHSSRSENRRNENPGSNRSDSFHEYRGKNPPQDTTRAKEELPDHYATLRISPLSTDEEIKSAAKRRRIEVHPDKLKKPGMSPNELAKIDDSAAKVGLAADLLQDPKQRLEYDRKFNGANH